MKKVNVAVIGGGAAGFFGAIRMAEQLDDLRIVILEKGKRPLEKVRISGGGRCNVTHACFEPRPLTKHYPRGKRELLGPFHSFMTGDMMAWLEERGVETKIEEDGRVFPVSNSSQTIIDCFLTEAEQLGIDLWLQCGVTEITPPTDDRPWLLETTSGTISAERVLVATGSSPQSWKMLEQLGCRTTARVPSLFTFNCKHPVIAEKMGLSVPNARLEIPQAGLHSDGPLLITHWGLSGPAVLRLSAWGARELAGLNYSLELRVNWTGSDTDLVREWITDQRKTAANRKVRSTPWPEIPRRLWEGLVEDSGCKAESNWADQSKQDLESLFNHMVSLPIQVTGKSTFKEEFVTAGGVELTEINFKTMEHKRYPGLFFAGEALDIDAITGGFNFQAAWTGAWIAANGVVASL